MDWIEVSVEVDGEAAEAVADLLSRYGHQGVVIEQAGFPIEVWPDEIPPADNLIVRAYYPDDERAEEATATLREAFYQMGRLYPLPEPQFRVVSEEDWATAWKAHYHPLRLGRRLYIRPAWIDLPDAQPDDIVLVMDLKLGARHVLALDTDPIAVSATVENANRNEVSDRLTAQVGSLEIVQSTARRFDLAVVNILAKVIIELCEQGLGQVVRPGGTGLFSGIIEDQADDVEAALRSTGLEPVGRRTQGDWVVIEARKPNA